MREMKDSGIEWIGEIPKEWKINKIKYMFSNGKGLPITKENLIDEGLPVISYGQIHSKNNNGTDIEKNLLRFVNENYSIRYPQCSISENDFVFADTSEDYDGCGNCVFKRDNSKVFAGYHTIILHSLLERDNRFLAYLFKTDTWRKQIREKVSGIKVFSITQKTLMNCKIILPGYKEEKIIADFLDTKCSEIDATAEDIQKEISLLEDYKKSVITEAVTKGLNPDAEMKDSGVKWLPKIPKHWKVIPSKYLFANSDIRRQTGDEQLTASQKYGIITQKDYTAKENAQVVLATQGLEKWKHVEPNDFIISLRSFQGGLEMSEITGCITWHYVVLKAQKKVYHKYYKWLFKSARYINALQGTCNFIRDGQDLRFSNFALVPLFELPLEEQQQIADYLDTKCTEIDTLIADKKRQLDILADYKKSLIYEYVTGKKEVPVKDF